LRFQYPRKRARAPLLCHTHALQGAHDAALATFPPSLEAPMELALPAPFA
jgi:hypothetical protein